MDILRPPTVWINGICYRKNTADECGGEMLDDGDRNYGGKCGFASQHWCA